MTRPQVSVGPAAQSRRDRQTSTPQLASSIDVASSPGSENVRHGRRRQGSGAVLGAVNAIRTMILRHELMPGEQLRQTDLAGQLDMSRIPIREALTMLAAAGLATHQLNVGYFVAKLQAADLDQIYRMRRAIETELLLGVRTPDEAELLNLRASNSRVVDALRRNDSDAQIMENRQFHFAIFELANLPLVLAEASRLWSMSEPYQMLLSGDPDALTRVTSAHERILEALISGDTGKLIRASDEHREHTRFQVVLLD